MALTCSWHVNTCLPVKEQASQGLNELIETMTKQGGLTPNCINSNTFLPHQGQGKWTPTSLSASKERTHMMETVPVWIEKTHRLASNSALWGNCARFLRRGKLWLKGHQQRLAASEALKAMGTLTQIWSSQTHRPSKWATEQQEKTLMTDQKWSPWLLAFPQTQPGFSLC